MFRRIIKILEHNGKAFNESKELYVFGINKNCDDNLEYDLFKCIEDMNRKGLIDINKIHKLFDFNYSMSLKNIAMNIKNPIINITDNTEFIKEKIKGDK